MNTYPNNLVNKTNKETKTLFEKLLGKEKDSDFNIVDELNKILKPVGGFFSQKKLTYLEILQKISKKQNIQTASLNIKEIEEAIMIKKFKENFESLSEKDKQQFQNQLTKELEKQGLDSSQIKSLTAIGAITAASASGFTMYIMASTIVGGITGLLGITLPFAFYTGMSSALSVITGPIGWVLGLGYLVYKFKDESLESGFEKLNLAMKSAINFLTGDYERACVIISIICSIRILNNEKISQKVKEKKKIIIDVESKKNLLKNEIEELSNAINEIELQLKQIKENLDNKFREKNNIENRIREFDLDISNLNSEINSLQKEIV